MYGPSERSAGFDAVALYDFVPVRKRPMYLPFLGCVIDAEAARVKHAAGVDGGSGVYNIAVSVRPIYVAIVYANKAADAHSYSGGYISNRDVNVRDARDYRPVVGADKSSERAGCAIGCHSHTA